MSEQPYSVVIDRRLRVQRTHRVKHFNAILTTIAYAIAGGAIWEPIFKPQPMRFAYVLGGMAAIVMFAISIYIAPLGEADDR